MLTTLNIKRHKAAHPPSLANLVTWLPAQTMAINFTNLHIIIQYKISSQKSDGDKDKADEGNKHLLTAVQ